MFIGWQIFHVLSHHSYCVLYLKFYCVYVSMSLMQTSDGDGDYENCTALPLPRNTSSSSSSSKTSLTEASSHDGDAAGGGGGEGGEKTPVAPPRTNQPYENISMAAASSLGKNGSDRKPSPPQPKPRNSRGSAEVLCNYA